MRAASLVALVSLSFLGFFGSFGAACSSSSGNNAQNEASTCPAASAVVAGASCDQAGSTCTGTVEDNCGTSLGSNFQCTCAAGEWRCEGPDASGGMCDGGDGGMGACPSPSAVVSGAACSVQGLSCTGTIDNNCGVPIGSNFGCMCFAGQWQCEAPDASGAICDAGDD